KDAPDSINGENRRNGGDKDLQAGGRRSEGWLTRDKRTGNQRARDWWARDRWIGDQLAGDQRAESQRAGDQQAGDLRHSNPYLRLLTEVARRQAELVAKWQLVGFIHGVMNTDNMALSGETIDYGPCAFMDAYDPDAVFSSIDIHGRYAYGRQPGIAAWNLARFAETLLPLLHEDENEAVELAREVVSGFGELFRAAWLRGMR